MTHDPHRNTKTPPPREPFQDFHRDPDGGTGTSFLFGALILLALGGFIYYYAGSDRSVVAIDDMRPPITQPSRTQPNSTTGSGPAADTTGSGKATNKTTQQPARPAE